MAAKPPEPPRNCINNSNNSFAKTHENINNNNNNNNNNNHNCPENRDNINNFERYNRNDDHIVDHGSHHDLNKTSAAPSKPTCNCSNISIMHLFHEMKQEFPTIPDHIVAQCVNENCHERDSCILMLRNELDLNPIPAQTYPAKVLQRQQQQQKVQQLQQQQQREYYTRPLKPVRAAPPIAVPDFDVSTFNNAPKPSLQAVSNSNQLKNCDAASNSNSNSQSVGVECCKAVPTFQCCRLGNCACAITSTTTTGNRKLDMPDLVTTTNSPAAMSPSHPATENTRVRPTTLDLSQSQQQHRQQQQLRQQLNVQLQQHLHQRQLTKPVRKAPLPPLPPKPTHITPPAALASKEPSATTTASAAAAQNGCCNSSLSSPLSSGESIASVNMNSLPSDTSTASTTSVDVATTSMASQLQHTPLKSPARHRAVISVQPKLPYSRDYLAASPAAAAGAAGSSSQKSFTSVNLTLRQPNASGSPSTIDISAGPGFSGSNGGTGLTYSSTSYDARRRCQKNFHITVSDAGGLFTASRIQSRNFSNSVDDQKQSPIMQRKKQQQQLCGSTNLKRARQQQHCGTISETESLHFPHEIDVFDENLQRQMARRDKLVFALRDNEKRLNQVEQEINILTEPISPGASERLEGEIQKLRCDCEIMLNELENSKRCVLSMENNNHTLEFTNSGRQILQQQQPFYQRQRPPRHPSLARQPMDFVQHHVISSAPTSAMNSPNQQMSPPLQLTAYQQTHQQQQQQLHRHQLHYLQQQQQQPFQASTDEEDYTDSNTDGGEDDMDNAGLDMWPCSMCTFRNHPQLNICECCENVRILPESLLSREDITITLSPGENRIVHSWIVS